MKVGDFNQEWLSENILGAYTFLHLHQLLVDSQWNYSRMKTFMLIKRYNHVKPFSLQRTHCPRWRSSSASTCWSGPCTPWSPPATGVWRVARRPPRCCCTPSSWPTPHTWAGRTVPGSTYRVRHLWFGNTENHFVLLGHYHIYMFKKGVPLLEVQLKPSVVDNFVSSMWDHIIL